MEAPAWVRELSPDLLIHGDWERMPAPERPPLTRAVQSMREFFTEQRWKLWTMEQWIIYTSVAMTIAYVIAEAAIVMRVASGKNLEVRP